MERTEESSEVDRPPSPPERGLLHVWQSGGHREQQSPERVLLSRPVLQTALGENHGLLLSQGGLVYSFGELLWRGLNVPMAAPVLEVSLQGRAVVRVAAGGFHCGAVTTQGSVYMWGENTAGQCGLGSNVTVVEPALLTVVDTELVPPAAVRVMDVDCGREHSLALSAQNELWAWGSGCQLGLVTTTFPVYRPQKVEHLAGRHVIQVACGAYHSLALVRTLSQPHNNPPHPVEKVKRERRWSSGHSFAAENLDPSMVEEDSHYCPLGVELSEVTTGECPRRSISRRSQMPDRSLLSISPGSVSRPLATLGKSHSEQNFICTKLDFEESSDQTDFSSKASLHWKNKNKFSKEQDLQTLLHKLSVHPIEIPHSSNSSDTESMSASVDSCATPSSDLYSSSYKDESPPKSQTNHFGPFSSTPVGVDEVHLCLREPSQSLFVESSSSLSDIRVKATEHRRRSLPGIPSHGSPRRRQHCACGSPYTGQRSGGSEEAGDGLPCLDTEVWSWGRGSEGQLGHGDQLARLQPLCIKPLTGEEVIKVAAGSHHSLAITAHCQVYSWGSNMCGQLGHVNSPVTVPKQTKLSDGLRVWDVSAGQSHSMLLADGDCVQPVLLYCGQQQEPKTEKCHTPQQGQRSPNRSESYSVRPALLPFCMEMGYISRVHSGGQTCAFLSDHNIMGFISAIHELASRERQFYSWSSSIKKVLLTPLRTREGVNPCLGDQCTRLFFTICDKFAPLNLLIGRHSTALSYFLHDLQSCDVTSLPLITRTEHFLDTFKQYCSSVGDFQVMGGFQSLQKLSNDCFGPKRSDLRELCVWGEDKDEVDLVSLLYWPLQQLHHYSRLLLKLAACYDVLTAEYQSLHQGFGLFESLSSSLLKRKKEAETTCNFWKTHSGKMTELLRLSHRRVVCESSHRNLTLQNAGRFSNHWFILFNDALVHTQGTVPSKSFFSTHHVYPLTCLWVKPVTENDNGLYAVKIVCPEENFTLVASTPQEKNKWLRALNQAVDQVLGGGGQGSSPGVTAMTRTASYTFSGEGRFKDARYRGQWQAGRVHGRGTMKWPDGRTYTGNFKNGLEDGYGECLMPSKALNKADCYQGHWKDGQIHGFGKYKYATGEVYEGCFFEGLRHGYGMLSSGRLARSSSSVFIGQWVHDKKMGYGVYDDITSGHKYMGMWVEDQRHGNAVVVTQHGLYFEGTFRENKMSGSGLLVSDDDTTFHGEFSDDWTINGKGLLHLANGDFFDGEFSGEWASLKVTGTYTKPTADEPVNKERNNTLALGQYVVPAAQRWLCVFDECWGRLGCDAPGAGQRTVAWDNIAVTITTTRRQTPDLSKSQSKILESLELIPQHEEIVTTANYDYVRRYLTKACETPLHPLGWLVETLVTVYRMTYVGSNRRLLRQAVQEVQAYLNHFYCIVRFLFPGLPEDGSVLPEPSLSPSRCRHSFISNTVEQLVVVVSCSSLLLPLLLPRLYPPLFTLYGLQQEQDDAKYWERVLRLNKSPDQALLSFLGVHQKFWPVWMSILGEKKQILSSSKDACYVSAVETLQQISTTFTPSDKLTVIQKTFEELTQEVKPLVEESFLWCMDDLFPLFLYVVIRARIKNLGAEVSLIEDLMDPNLEHGEMGLMFTTLKACYIQIQQESMM
ncbi:alsin-like isoform X2 [Eucyclogobius newberryi]|uniref:alsin-like isoform X2 n=1 Tax=Eucyclogobius newberryi TaxID=166745 RepID=UPI003B593265